MSNTITTEGGNFSSMPNDLLNDSDISLTAKGLYIFMRGKPPAWNFTIRSMAKQLKEGETAISNALNELKKHGWISYTKRSDGKGVYHLFWIAQVMDEPSNPKQGNPVKADPKPENPNQGFPKKGKPQRISKTEPVVRLIDKKEKEQKKNGLPFSMDLEWQPDLAQLKPRAVMSGLKTEQFTPEVIGEFKIHYEATGRASTDAQWTATLISWVKRRNTWSAQSGSNNQNNHTPSTPDLSWAKDLDAYE